MPETPYTPTHLRCYSYPGGLCIHNHIRLSMESLSGPEDMLRVAFAITFIPSLPPTLLTHLSLFLPLLSAFLSSW